MRFAAPTGWSDDDLPESRDAKLMHIRTWGDGGLGSHTTATIGVVGLVQGSERAWHEITALPLVA